MYHDNTPDSHLLVEKGQHDTEFGQPTLHRCTTSLLLWNESQIVQTSMPQRNSCKKTWKFENPWARTHELPSLMRQSLPRTLVSTK